MRHQRRNTTAPQPSLETPALFRKTVRLAYYRVIVEVLAAVKLQCQDCVGFVLELQPKGTKTSHNPNADTHAVIGFCRFVLVPANIFLALIINGPQAEKVNGEPLFEDRSPKVAQRLRIRNTTDTSPHPRFRRAIQWNRFRETAQRFYDNLATRPLMLKTDVIPEYWATSGE